MPPKSHTGRAAFDTLAGLVGEPIARRFCEAFGGTDFYVPTTRALKDGHPLVVALGRDDAERFCIALHPGKMVVPLGPMEAGFRRRARAIRELRAQGHTQNRIARLLGIHVETVRRRDRLDRRARREKLGIILEKPGAEKQP